MWNKINKPVELCDFDENFDENYQGKETFWELIWTSLNLDSKHLYERGLTWLSDWLGKFYTNTKYSSCILFATFGLPRLLKYFSKHLFQFHKRGNNMIFPNIETSGKYSIWCYWILLHFGTFANVKNKLPIHKKSWEKIMTSSDYWVGTVFTYLDFYTIMELCKTLNLILACK